MATFTFKRGAPISVELVIDDAGTYDPTTLTVTAKLKAALGNGSAPPPSVAALAAMDVAYTAPVSPAAGYWTLTVPDGALDNPPCGLYVVDAEIKSGADVLQVTDLIVIEIAESVTPA